jgi:hypothetical protein
MPMVAEFAPAALRTPTVATTIHTTADQNTIVVVFGSDLLGIMELVCCGDECLYGCASGSALFHSRTVPCEDL